MTSGTAGSGTEQEPRQPQDPPRNPAPPWQAAMVLAAMPQSTAVAALRQPCRDTSSLVGHGNVVLALPSLA